MRQAWPITGLFISTGSHEIHRPVLELEHALGVHRNTVLTAVNKLIAEGWLSARPGSGTTAAELPSAKPPSPSSSKTARSSATSAASAESTPAAARPCSRRSKSAYPAHSRSMSPAAAWRCGPGPRRATTPTRGPSVPSIAASRSVQGVATGAAAGACMRFRLGFAGLDEREIDEAVRRLAKARA